MVAGRSYRIGHRGHAEDRTPNRTSVAKQHARQPASWERPAIFRFLQETGGVAESEMRRVFNMGIGMAMVVSEFYAASIQTQLAAAGIRATPIGRISFGTGKVRYV